MGKTGLKESASAAKQAKIAKKVPKGAVTEAKSFRDGLIYLYQRADFKKPTWLCRVKVPNGSGYVNRSTGMGDEHKRRQGDHIPPSTRKMRDYGARGRSGKFLKKIRIANRSTRTADADL